jgi:hypothetical protein
VNRLGCFVAGVVVGLMVMQVGHWLYLRSSDYGAAFGMTLVSGWFFIWIGHVLGEEWE